MADSDQGFWEAEARIQVALQNNSQSLDLGRLGLQKVPESLGNLSSLQALFLHENQLSQAPESLGNLSSLQRLDLNNNQLSEVPESLGNLSSLQQLDLSNNQLSELPEFLGQLNDLLILKLSNNQLSEVPESLGRLSSLRELHLDSNQLSELPESLGQLSSLHLLRLEYNQLSELPGSLRQLSSLRELYLHSNYALELPPEVLGPSWQKRNMLKIGVPPQDIFNYYFSSIDRDSPPLNEAKLILVGFGAVGKTSLVNRLVDGTFDPTEAKTDGINITEWHIQIHADEDIRLNIWDFGGQEIMHSTHQFFLTERSLYLLVLNGRQGHEDEDAEYWLNLIQSFGSDSPVIIVLNKFSETSFDLRANF